MPWYVKLSNLSTETGLQVQTNKQHVNVKYITGHCMYDTMSQKDLGLGECCL